MTHPLLIAGNYGRIARLAGLAPSHVSRVIRGVRGVSFIVAQRVADAAGVTLDELRSHIAAMIAAGAPAQSKSERRRAYFAAKRASLPRANKAA